MNQVSSTAIIFFSLAILACFSLLVVACWMAWRYTQKETCLRSELPRSMEAVIHQFKLVSEGIRPRAGTVYSWVESARGCLIHTIVSDGSNKPHRLRVRSPSFAGLQVLPAILPGHLLSDVVVAIASVDPILGDVDR